MSEKASVLEQEKSLPPRRTKHSKKKNRWIKAEVIETNRAKKEIKSAKKRNGHKQKEEKKRNPFILARILLTLFILLVGSLITYYTWQWFNSNGKLL